MDRKAIWAVKKCRMIWEIEARYGTGSKRKMYTMAGFEPGSDENDCPACDYHTDGGVLTRPPFNTSNPLNSCIIPWPTESGRCNAKGSPFVGWLLGRTPNVRKHFAEQIVALCDKTLTDLGV